jgi:hypothetical protein
MAKRHIKNAYLQMNQALYAHMNNKRKMKKKCLSSLAIKEMKIKTTLGFHLSPVRMAIIKNTTNNRW